MAVFQNIRIFFLGFAGCLPALVFSAEPSDDFSAVYGGGELVSIATGSKQPLAMAPAVASVITEEEIRATGFLDLDDVLEIVPGITIGRSQTAYAPQYVVRGIFSEVNPQVLLLINGVPLTQLYSGHRGYGWGGMPVRNIERIEVIRGPGSAVYGADAYAGVINVITKDYSATRNEIGAQMGSFRTKEAWWLQRGAWKDFKFSFGLNLLRTKGQREKVLFDNQSASDLQFGTNVSEAPGPVNTGKDWLETHLYANYKDMQLRLVHQGRFHVKTGAGVALALDPRGEQTARRFIGDWAYTYANEHSPWNITAQVSHLNLFDGTDFFLFPPGAFGAPYPDGVRGAPETHERHWRGGLSAFYTGFTNHRVRLGVGGIAGKLKSKERKNFNAALAPLGSFRDVTHDPALVFMLPHARTTRFAFFQDEWSFAQNADLTLGIRGDWFNDFGRTINPRAALVWQATNKLTVKWLYGRAFRPPNFSEQYLINNPVAIGKTGLSPETIETAELAGGFVPNNRFKMNANVFLYRMNKILRYVTNPSIGKQEARNTGRQWGQGIETDFEWNTTDTHKIIGNYAFQRSTDRATRKDAGNAPHHQGYLQWEWKFMPKWTSTVQTNLIGRRFRVFGDTRSNLAGFGTIGANIRYGSQTDPWSVGVIAQNIFDKIGRVPIVSPGLIPGDLPLAGRAMFVEAEFRL